MKKGIKLASILVWVMLMVGCSHKQEQGINLDSGHGNMVVSQEVRNTIEERQDPFDSDPIMESEGPTIKNLLIGHGLSGVAFIDLGSIDTQQMASVVGFYDAVGNQLNYSGKQESSFSCRDQNKREKPDCSRYTFKYPPFSFSFLSTKESPSAEVASGELLLRTKNYTITVKKYEYSDLKLFERDIQREFDESSDYCLYMNGSTQTMYGMETETTYPVRLSQGEGQEGTDPSAPSVESFSGAKMFGWTWGLGKNLNQMFTEGKIIYIPLARKKNGSCIGADRVGHLVLFKDQKVFYTIISDMREDIFIYNGIYETPFSVDVIE